jgi:hypothetical protein
MSIEAQKAELKNKINKHVRLFAIQNGYNPRRINFEIKKAFRVPRADMSIGQLKDVYNYILMYYPASYPSEDQKEVELMPRPGESGKKVPGQNSSYNFSQQSLF